MSGPDLLPAAVLRRKAVVYVRQSSQTQVQVNLESQRRQYDLVDEARRRGFQQVEVIDDDLGRSASGMVARPGFDRLVAWLCAGEVGAVLCFDASRLARNGRDWHHLLELCGLVDARVIDLDGVYDPCRPNDRLLLGMKGSISEFELGVLRSRMLDAARAKARRGELRISVPIGSAERSATGDRGAALRHVLPRRIDLVFRRGHPLTDEGDRNRAHDCRRGDGEEVLRQRQLHRDQHPDRDRREDRADAPDARREADSRRADRRRIELARVGIQQDLRTQRRRADHGDDEEQRLNAGAEQRQRNRRDHEEREGHPLDVELVCEPPAAHGADDAPAL